LGYNVLRMKNSEVKKIAKKLEQYRKEKDISIEELARQVGISYSAMWNWIRGKRGISRLGLRAVKDAKIIKI